MYNNVNHKLNKMIREMVIVLVIMWILIGLLSLQKKETETEHKATDYIVLFPYDITKYHDIIQNPIRRKPEIEPQSRIMTLSTESTGEEIVLEDEVVSYRIVLTEEEKALLFTTIYLEMGSENLSKESRLVIGSTIINRVLSDKYANTLKDVVYQKNQYSVVRKMNSNKEYKSNILYYSDYLKSINYEWLADEIWDVVDKVCITDYSSGGLHFCEYSSISKANKKWFDSLEFIGEWHGVRIYK